MASGIGIEGTCSLGYFINRSKTSTFNPYITIESAAYNPGDFPIAAIEYAGFSPNKIISINHRDQEIYENTSDFGIVETLYYSEDSGLYPITHYAHSSSFNDKLDYLVTEYNSDGQNGKPLFYQYEPMFNIASEVSGIAPINIYKNNETKLKPSEYKIQYSYNLLSTTNPRYSGTVWEPIRKENTHRARILFPYESHSPDIFYSIEYTKSINNISSYQKEIIELRPIHDKSDYSIVNSGLIVNISGRIQNTKTPLNIVKNPATRINAIDLISIKGQNGYVSDTSAQWKLRLNLGSFLIASGFYNNATEKMYNLEDHYNSGIYIPLTNIKPKLVDTNILKIKEAPIYINESVFTYPNYNINIYDKTASGITEEEGTLSIDVNGITRNDIKIKSIDRVKGYIELDKDLDSTDEVEVSCYLDNSGWILLENLELNPKINDSISAYHISGYYDGLGIALRPWDGLSGTWYPHIYDASVDEASRTAYSIVPVPESDSSGVPWIDDEFFTICDININRLTTEMVTLTDARRVGGGIDRYSQLDEWVQNKLNTTSHEIEWYTDRGNYDGTPLPHAGTIVLHIPNESLNAERQNWIDYYKKTLGPDEAEKKAIDEFNFYLDQVIKRYVSAGTNYIILPTTSGVFNGEIMELR